MGRESQMPWQQEGLRMVFKRKSVLIGVLIMSILLLVSINITTFLK